MLGEVESELPAPTRKQDGFKQGYSVLFETLPVLDSVGGAPREDGDELPEGAGVSRSVGVCEQHDVHEQQCVHEQQVDSHAATLTHTPLRYRNLTNQITDKIC